ncbi:hypothetical protein LCGC14_2056510 [marine sediment metagenome]|uniref:Uncharacterized protein n=1 Tax=marine sediment metagenome TaxID=412755 RepID=A0A0F9FA03_9ZZZZ
MEFLAFSIAVVLVALIAFFAGFVIGRAVERVRSREVSGWRKSAGNKPGSGMDDISSP